MADFKGMKPAPTIASHLAQIDTFIQQSPIDGHSATQNTSVFVGRTKTTLFVAFVCFDDHPQMIRAHLARREKILNDDTVSLLVDPFQDRRRGVLFTVNPLGVQADASWTENSSPDYSYDQVWDSEGRVTAQGWIAVMSIPFRSLRFRADGSDWGIVLLRNLPRNSEEDYWPRVSSSISGILTQEGTLNGIGDVSGSHNIQLNPYILGQKEKALLTQDPTNPYFSSRSLEGTAGGEAKVILRDSIVIDGTINPDFSDTESDQPQFTVNQRYPVFFPELRPFFLENANYFTTIIPLVYTRNIIRPEFGARITGKLGRTNIGLLATDDREPGQAFTPRDPLYKKRALFAIGRVSVDLGKRGSNLGLLYTDEEFGGGWNRIGGGDFTVRFDDHWTAFGQMVESSTKSNSDNKSPRLYSAGPATDVQVTRTGHSFNMDSEFKDFSTAFQSQVGFIQTTNVRSAEVHPQYRWFTNLRTVQSYGVETKQQIAFDHQGNRVYHYSSFDAYALLQGNTLLAPIFGQNSDTLGPQNGYTLRQDRNFTENYGGFVAKGAPLPQLSFTFQALRSGNVNYNPVHGAIPSLLKQETLQALITVQPMRNLTVDNTYLLDRDHTAHSGADVYETQTFRTKLNYQFTKALSARVIVEYDSTIVNPLQTSLSRTKEVQSQALITWLPHPGTAIYFGYNNDLQNLDHHVCAMAPTLGTCDPSMPILPRSNQYLDSGKQIFIKGSYLLRF